MKANLPSSLEKQRSIAKQTHDNAEPSTKNAATPSRLTISRRLPLAHERNHNLVMARASGCAVHEQGASELMSRDFVDTTEPVAKLNTEARSNSSLPTCNSVMKTEINSPTSPHPNSNTKNDTERDNKEDSETDFQPDIDVPTTLNDRGSETNFLFGPHSILGTHPLYSQLPPGHPDRIAYLNRLAEENLARIRLSSAKIAAIEMKMEVLNSAALALVGNSPIYAFRGNNMIPNNDNVRGRRVSQHVNQSFVTDQEGQSTEDRPS
jgi:hypothetical protein